ncbi:MAG TPA: preprotein translocase subunit YajC [bacterium]|jgi:preprotein translocase subunit YajC
MVFAVLAQGASPGASGILGFLPFILIMVIVYFLMLRPQMRKQKQHSRMVAELRKGDDIVTAGGLHGRVVAAIEKESSIKVEIARGIIVTVERSSVARKASASSETNPGESKGAEQRPSKSDAVQSRKEIWGGNQSSAVVTSTGGSNVEDASEGGVATNRESSGRRGRNRRFRHRRPHHGPGRDATPGNGTPPSQSN